MFNTDPSQHQFTVTWSRGPTGKLQINWMMCCTQLHPIRTQEVKTMKKAPSHKAKSALITNGTPRGIRTPDLQIRSCLHTPNKRYQETTRAKKISVFHFRLPPSYSLFWLVMVAKW